MHALTLLLLTFTAENCATDWSVVKGRTAWARQEPAGWVVFDVAAENIRLAKDGVWYIVPPRDPAMWHWSDWESALEFARRDTLAKPLIPPVLIRPSQSAGCANGNCRVRRGRR